MCALTLQRPEGLARLLEHLAAVVVPSGVEIVVVIVDNDPDRTAENFVRGLGPSFPHPLRYEHEPRRGIPYGRNRAVLASGDTDFIAFLDDDEYPEPGWLAELLRVQAAYDADVVAGPVLPDYREGIPRWIVENGFFERPRHPTGTVRPSATTSNVLVARQVFATGPFAEWMGLTGGDDTHFFTRARIAGHRIVWADDAPVHEVVSATRARAGWLIRRQFRRGATLSHCLRDLEDSPTRRVLRVGRAGLHVLEGLATLASAPLRGRAALVAGLQRLALAAGLVAGLWNVQYDEYRTVHGS